MKNVEPFFLRERLQKAKMIEAFCEDFLGKELAALRILDIGAGNGEIAEYFAGKNEVFAVDIEDNRNDKNGKARFTLVDSERLPFPDAHFDIVFSHHVIEHVVDQALHLAEIKRTLKPDGFCYLANPNRSSPIMEEHKGNEQVFRHKDMAPFHGQCGFGSTEYSVKLLKEPERFYCRTKIGRFIPIWILNRLRFLFPSNFFILVPKGKE